MKYRVWGLLGKRSEKGLAKMRDSGHPQRNGGKKGDRKKDHVKRGRNLTGKKEAKH